VKPTMVAGFKLVQQISTFSAQLQEHLRMIIIHVKKCQPFF